MDADTERMLANLPIDLWAQGWELVPGEVHVLDARGGGCHIVVYVRPFDRILDIPKPKHGYVMRRSGAPFIRVSRPTRCVARAGTRPSPRPSPGCGPSMRSA